MGLGTGVLLVVVGLVLLTGVVHVDGFDPAPLGGTVLALGVLTILVALVVHRRRTRAPSPSPPLADR